MHALRTHLSPKCLAPDEHHPKDNALWEEIQKSKIFAYSSRGGDLTEEEKKARESKASARSYRKHQGERTARSKRNREELREIADVAAHLSDAVDPLLAAAEHTSAALRDLQESLPPLETYIPLDDPPHIHTFFRFVSFFLPQDSWPPVAPDEMDLSQAPTKLVDLIPGVSHWREVSRICHSDKGTGVDTRAQTLLNASWKVLDETLRPEEGVEQPADWIAPTAEGVEEFQARSSRHREIYELYNRWLEISADQLDWVTIKKASLWQLTREIITAEMVQGVRNLMAQAKDGKSKLAERDRRRPKRKSTE